MFRLMSRELVLCLGLLLLLMFFLPSLLPLVAVWIRSVFAWKAVFVVGDAANLFAFSLVRCSVNDWSILPSDTSS